MDKKSLIGLGLIAVILIAWLAISAPSKEQIARTKQIKDSITLATKNAEELAHIKPLIQNAKHDAAIAELPMLSDSLRRLALTSQYKNFAVSAQGKEEIVTIENQNIKAYISTKGGSVEKVELKNYHRYGKTQPLILFEKSDSTYQHLQFNAFATNTPIETDSFYFKASAPAIT